MTGHDLDTYLELVADRRRRRIIHYLRQAANNTTTFDCLVDQLWDDLGGENDPPRNREQIALELHHTHLPKLAAHDVVEYDQGSGTVRYHPDEGVEAVLDALPGGVDASPPDP